MKIKRIRQVVAFVLCVGLTLGMFDGIPFVKENLSTVQKVEAATTLRWPVPGHLRRSRGYHDRSAIDISDSSIRGATIVASLNGVVTHVYKCAHNTYGSNFKCCQGFGTGVVIRGTDGRIYQYAHMLAGSVPANVYVGATIKTGQKIGEVGNTGNSSGNHLHFGISYGNYWNQSGINPDNETYVYVDEPTYAISTGNATNITNNNARISGSMSPAGNVSSWGFFLGTNANAMQKYTVGGATYSGNMACDIGNYQKLHYGTVYYYKMWGVVNGQEKHGEIKSFRTTASKPDIPTLKINKTDQNIGLEAPASVYWSGVNNASYYKLYLYDEEERLIETSENITGTKYAFSAMKKTGVYHAKIEAYNEVGTKGMSNEVTFTVHPDVKVTFMDADSFVDVGEDYKPEQLGEQSIHYGQTASAPANPEHTGYTFKKWSKELKDIKEDTVIKAEYDINQYTVRYVDSSTSQVLGTEKVNYFSSAKPIDFSVPTGYVKTGYDGWDKDYKCITENITLNTCIGWYNENFPIYAEAVSAVREYDAEESDNEGYTVEARVTNWDKSTTKGRVVVALKTKQGKLLTSTESSAFSVKKSKSKTIEVFVPYDKAASMAEIYVIGQYTDAVPITTTASNNATLEIDQSSVYTNWSTEEPPETATQKEERTEYRYRDKKTTTSYETSLSGYTCSGSSWEQSGSSNMDYIPSFPAGFDTGSWLYATYHKNPVTPSETATNKTTVSTSTVGWLYYHWCRNGTYYGSQKNRTVNGTYTPKWWNFHAFVTGVALGWDSKGAFYGDLPAQCGDTYWWIGNGEGVAANVPVLRCNYTNYRKLFHYYTWSDFSGWSTTKQETTENREVESRKVYRYLTDEMMKEDTSGKERTIEGTMGKSFAGKEATLFIYKIDEASDYTNEYVAQTRLDDEGNYKFTFKLREEPSISTGDLTVVLGVEGTSTAIYLDTIEAPKKKHKVRFIDYKGEVISEQEVVEGQAAELPSTKATERVGYTFAKWSDTNINITEDKDIYAEYILNQYQVVFVDWKANTVKVENFEYGSRLTTPVAEEPDEGVAVEWDLVADGMETVTENLVVCTRYKKRTFDVKILGFDGEVVDEQKVEYGNAVSLPELDATGNGCTFFGWKNIADGSEKDFTDLIIKEETTLKPDFSYNETVEIPTADFESGEYNKPLKVTLSTNTAGAEIYYTLDGSDPSGAGGIRYEAPISVEEAAELKYYAKAEKKNDSAINENYYVVNYDGARSAWMPYKKLPQKVKENQKDYDIYSDTGYAFKETKEIESVQEKNELERSGWESDSEGWSEYSEWQDTPIVENGTYIEAQVETQPVYSSANKYQYSHYVYMDGTATCYSPTEVEGVSCKFETIELDKSLTIAGFTKEGTTYFVQDGAEWFNQKKITGKTQTGTQYRSRHKRIAMAKWTDYTVDVPSQEETREYKQEEVFSYVRHKNYIVELFSLTNKLQTMIMEEGSIIDLSDLKKVDGYTNEEIYTDEDFMNIWDTKTDRVNGNLKLYIKTSPEKYNVSFKDADGEEIETQEVSYLEEAQPPVPKEKEGKKFIGWSTKEYLCVTQNLNVVAEYVPEEEYATVQFGESELLMNIGGTEQIHSSITPVSQSESTLYWESSDNSVAVVSDQGVVTGISEGTAVISATLEQTGEKAECKIQVKTTAGAESTQIPDMPSQAPSEVTGGVSLPTPQNVPSLKTNSDNANNGDESKKENSKLEKVKKVRVKRMTKRRVRVEWKKTKGVSGYQIQYALNKAFTKNKKSKLVTKNQFTIKKLKCWTAN